MQNKKKGTLASLFVLAVLCLSSITAIGMSGKQPTEVGVLGGGANPEKTILFPAAECNVRASMAKSREKLEERHNFLSPQGIFPWPDITGRFNINGIWLSETRGVYVVISQKNHRDSPEYGALSVEFYSSCDNSLIARGKRVLTKDDWADTKVMIYLTQHDLHGRRLFAEVRAMMGNGADVDDNVAIRILELRTRTEVRDLLFTRRFL